MNGSLFNRYRGRIRNPNTMQVVVKNLAAAHNAYGIIEENDAIFAIIEGGTIFNR